MNGKERPRPISRRWSLRIWSMRLSNTVEISLSFSCSQTRHLRSSARCSDGKRWALRFRGRVTITHVSASGAGGAQNGTHKATSGTSADRLPPSINVPFAVALREIKVELGLAPFGGFGLLPSLLIVGSLLDLALFGHQ